MSTLEDTLMAFENRNNEGAIFKNNDRGANDPHFTGSVKVDKVDYWVDAYVCEAKTGNRYFKLKLRPKVEKVSDDEIDDLMGDDIPF